MDRSRGGVSRHGASIGDVRNMEMMQLQEEAVRLPPLAELVIVGGLGVFLMVAPNIGSFVVEKWVQLKGKVILLKAGLSQTSITKKLELLNRRRKSGSVVRVVGSILPDIMFTPPCRIYIPNWAQLDATKVWGPEPVVLTNLANKSKQPDLPSENTVGDGLFAFEINSDVMSSMSGDEEETDDDNASSTPEGWTSEQRKLNGLYNPTLINATDCSFARCSTPKQNLEALQFNASQILSSHASQVSEEREEILELKKMVTGLMLHIENLSQTIQTQMVAQQPITYAQVTSGVAVAPVTNPTPIAPVIPPTAPPNAPSVPTGAPAPPPPPPPPPPPMPAIPSSNKLIITKKGNQENLIEKKPQLSLTDVLKELPNAKLRRIERSPGGTPLKPQMKLSAKEIPLDLGNQLAFVLRKRYESMHSPVCETDTDNDKENDGSDDSFDDTPNPAKRVLFPANLSPRRRSFGNAKPKENHSPFGQHLLKKRSPFASKEDNSKTTSSSPARVLRQQN